MPRDLIDAIEAQRNEAMSRGALLAAKCAGLQREIDRLQAELEAAKKPTETD